MFSVLKCSPFVLIGVIFVCVVVGIGQAIPRTTIIGRMRVASLFSSGRKNARGVWPLTTERVSTRYGFNPHACIERFITPDVGRSCEFRGGKS